MAVRVSLLLELLTVNSRFLPMSPFCSPPDLRYASILTIDYSLFIFLLSPFFSALPYKISVTPLFTAFTHFDRGGGVFRSSDIQTFRPADLFLFINLRVAPPTTPFF